MTAPATTTAASSTGTPTPHPALSPLLPVAPTVPAPVHVHWDDATRDAQADAHRMHLRMTGLQVSDLADEIRSFFNDDSNEMRWSRGIGVRLITDWLAAHPGDTWQDRWRLAGADESWAAWLGTHTTTTQRNLRKGVEALVLTRTVRPNRTWVWSTKASGRLLGRFLEKNDPTWPARLASRAQVDGMSHREAQYMLANVVRLCASTGKVVAALVPEDLVDIPVVKEAHFSRMGNYTYRALREEGVFGPDAPDGLRAVRRPRQRTVEQIVDAHTVRSPLVRDAFVAYLRERQPELTHGSLINLAGNLCGAFWAEVQKIDPDISDLRVAPAIAARWKEQLLMIPRRGKQRSRLRSEAHVHTILTCVRAFYQDLAEWAQDEPERWAHLVAFSPVKASETTGNSAIRRQQKARQDHVTRTLLPVLPRLREATLARMNRGVEMREALSGIGEDETRTFDGRVYRRGAEPTGHTRHVWVQTGDDDPIDLVWEQEDAFRAWAIVEVMSLIGPRIEEMLELTALDLVPFRTKKNRLVPLLHINPGKTNSERMLPLDSHGADVFAAIKRHVTGPNGTVPLTSRWDPSERAYSPMLPHLFQWSYGGRNEVLSNRAVTDIIERACALAGIKEHFRPHDFRRMFITEQVNSGLPIHIVAKLVGHRSIVTTEGYTAVYSEEVVDAFHNHVAQKREKRPPEEYRDPTPEEFADFEAHFGKRQLRLGRCDRTYGTDCPRQHACHRCPLLALQDEDEQRLLAMRKEITTQVVAAVDDGLPGEVERLSADLAGIEDRLATIRHHRATRAALLREQDTQ